MKRYNEHTSSISTRLLFNFYNFSFTIVSIEALTLNSSIYFNLISTLGLPVVVLFFWFQNFFWIIIFVLIQISEKENIILLKSISQNSKCSCNISLIFPCTDNCKSIYPATFNLVKTTFFVISSGIKT